LTPKIAVLASGSGSNFQAIIDSIADGFLDAKICGLLSNKDSTGAIEKAKVAKIPYAIVKPSDYSTEDFPHAILNQLLSWAPDIIVLAGYLVKIPSEIIQAYEGKIINIHPSLLPAYGGKGFYGLKVHEAVIRDKQKFSGCTVHIVTEEFDEGPIIAQKTVPVLSDDTPQTLAARVLKEEHTLLPETIKSLITNL
jgi:phosphoribosylglycinamide formyltransferase 1